MKAHGTIDVVSKMIFTRGEYHQAKRKYHGFYDVLKALFLTNTVIFIGCGMEDPDVMLLLEDVNIIGGSEKNHYVLVKDNSVSEIVKADWKNTYNIVPLEFGPSYSDLLGGLQELNGLVESESCLLYTSPSPRDRTRSRMPSSA